jgi:paraquat-inducible protein B
MNDVSPEPTEAPGTEIRAAIVEDRRSGGFGIVWLVPLAALLVTLLVGWRAWQTRGIRVTVDFPAAHGLRAGDPVRSLGVDVGVVHDVSLVDVDEYVDRGATSMPAVRVLLAIDRDARGFLRADTRFWIQRPQVDFDGVEGLDTLTGSRYVGLDPGAGRPLVGPFTGLDTPPVLEDGAGDTGGLDIVLESRDRAGMRAGGTVGYRGVVVGRILDVSLSSDARRVEARVRIESRYAPLVRAGTRFFSTSGIGLELGFQGLRADIESLESVVTGGVGFATPPDAGERAVTGARFDLAERPEASWLAWQPRMAIGVVGFEEPERHRAVLRYRVGLLGRERTRSGWAVMMTGGAVLLPAGVVTAPEDARDAKLEIGGRAVPLADLGAVVGTEGLVAGSAVGRIAAQTVQTTFEIESESASSMQVAGGVPEAEVTLLVHRDPGSEPLPIPGHRWREENGGILIDAGTGLTDIDDGAPVTDGSTGRLIGVLAVIDGETRVAVLAGE